MSQFSRFAVLPLGFLYFLILLTLILVTVASADGELEEPMGAVPSSNPIPSSNFGKTRKFIPGEEVITPTGKTVKVWSTEGPVPVSRAPRPFEDSAQSRLPSNTHLVVDENLLKHQAADRPQAAAPGLSNSAPNSAPNSAATSSGEGDGLSDSFAVSPQK